jgi:hypothetical protein
MPIPDKIAIAKQKYDEKLKELQILASEEPLDPDFERNSIEILLKMLELKTEMDILEKVHRHQSA